MVVVLNSSLLGVSPKESAFGAAFVLLDDFFPDVHHNKAESKGNTQEKTSLAGKKTKNRGKFVESVSP